MPPQEVFLKYNSQLPKALKTTLAGLESLFSSYAPSQLSPVCLSSSILVTPSLNTEKESRVDS